MELEGNSNSGTSAAFLDRLRQKHSGPLDVIWDNAPAHRGEAVREYLRTPGLELRLVNPRFHEGRLCRGTARTSTPMRQSGAGRGRKPPETCAWGPRPWYRRESETSSTGCPAGRRRSSAAAAPSCNQGPKGYCGNPSPNANPRQMHIPPWLWFSITTTVQGGMSEDARSAARRLAWERLARSLHSCVSSSHRSSSAGPNRSRGSISRTTR